LLTLGADRFLVFAGRYATSPVDPVLWLQRLRSSTCFLRCASAGTADFSCCDVCSRHFSAANDMQPICFEIIFRIYDFKTIVQTGSCKLPISNLQQQAGK
jgi:hypothetical protein